MNRNPDRVMELNKRLVHELSDVVMPVHRDWLGDNYLDPEIEAGDLMLATLGAFALLVATLDETIRENRSEQAYNTFIEYTAEVFKEFLRMYSLPDDEERNPSKLN